MKGHSFEEVKNDLSVMGQDGASLVLPENAFMCLECEVGILIVLQSIEVFLMHLNFCKKFFTFLNILALVKFKPLKSSVAPYTFSMLLQSA